MLANGFHVAAESFNIDEALETTNIHSIAGILPSDVPLLTSRPFVHTSSYNIGCGACWGGVGNIRPGEISLAHHGVLFLRNCLNLPETCLKYSRQPLEDGFFTISRTKQTDVYSCELYACLLDESLPLCHMRPN
jgi:magnesium chelatase family protein